MNNFLSNYSAEELIKELNARPDVLGIKVFEKELIDKYITESGHKPTKRNFEKVKKYPYIQKLFEISEKDIRIIETAVGDALDK